jgi:uncharacterized membrane protein YbhN (UPF0104 family)
VEALPSFHRGRALAIALIITLVSLLGVGLALMALQPTDAPFEEVKTLILGAKVWLLFAGILAMSIGMLFVAIRWRCLLPDKEGIPPFGLTGIVCSGLLMNYAVPGPAGEFAAAYLVKERYKKPATIALAASLHARLIGLGTAGLLAGLVGAFAALPIPPEHKSKIGIAIGLIAVGALAVALLSAFPKLLTVLSDRTVGALGRRFKGRAGRACSALDEGLSSLAQGLGQVGRLGFRAYGQAAIWALLAHLFVFMGIALSCEAMGINPYLPGILLSYCAATAAVIALIAFPGSQIGWDLLLVAFLKFTAGLSPVEAWAVVVVVRVQQLLLLILGAGFLMHYSRDIGDGEPRDRPKVQRPA